MYFQLCDDVIFHIMAHSLPQSWLQCIHAFMRLKAGANHKFPTYLHTVLTL